MMNGISKRLSDNAALTEKRLDAYLSERRAEYGILTDSMRYSALSGGKRIRPTLTLEFCRMYGGSDEAALPFACALECIHTYSLIHDDLPCMDNDGLRRGKPTNHTVYGEAVAMLAGDALLTAAFGIAASNEYAPPETITAAVRLLSDNAGPHGMVGGQVMDMLGETTAQELDELEETQSLKTGKLIEAACLLGVYAAGHQSDRDACETAKAYALGVGRSFQIIDDILDVTGDTATFGKPTGSDAQNHKTTFATVMTVEEAYNYAKALTKRSVDALPGRESGGETLAGLAEYLLERRF